MPTFLLALLTEIVIAFTGQSLNDEMFTNYGGAATPAPNTYLWNPTTGSWGPVTGNGAIQYANMMHAQTGLPIYLYNASWGGSALLAADANPSYPWLYWLNTAANAPLDRLFSMVAAGGKVPNLIEHDQGQQDFFSTLPNLYGDFRTGQGTLYNLMLTQWSKTPADLPINVAISGKASYGQAMSKYVMQAQIDFSISTPGAALGVSYYDLPYRSDGTHLTGYGYELKGCRMAIVALNRLDAAQWPNGAGPRFTEAYRQVTSGVTNTVLLKTDRPLYYPKTPWAAPVNLAGFQVWNAAWSPVTISSASVIGRYVRLDLAYNSPMHICYQGDNAQPVGAPYDETDLFGIGQGMPATPLCFDLYAP